MSDTVPAGVPPTARRQCRFGEGSSIGSNHMVGGPRTGGPVSGGGRPPQRQMRGGLQRFLLTPEMLTMQREGMAPEVIALSVQSQVCPAGTVRDARPCAPTDFPLASCTDNTRLKVLGPATDPVAVVVPPDTTQLPGVGFAPRRSKLTMTGREVWDEHADS